MQEPISITNQTLELADCRDRWTFHEGYQCWCLENILYTLSATTPEFQQLSIFVPKPYMASGGAVVPGGAAGRFTARTAPVVFENASAGYM